MSPHHPMRSGKRTRALRQAPRHSHTAPLGACLRTPPVSRPLPPPREVPHHRTAPCSEYAFLHPKYTFREVSRWRRVWVRWQDPRGRAGWLSRSLPESPCPSPPVTQSNLRLLTDGSGTKAPKTTHRHPRRLGGDAGVRDGSSALRRKAQVVRTVPYRAKSSKIRPVPRTTEVSGSSSIRTGKPVSSISRWSRPRI